MDCDENIFLILLTFVKGDLISLLNAKEIIKIKKLKIIKLYLKNLTIIFNILNKITKK